MHTRAWITLIGTVMLLSACKPYPRYRDGGAELPPERDPVGVTWQVPEYVRLGLIMQEYLGRPYAGTSEYDRGLDCSMFTRVVYRRYDGTELPRTAREQFEVGEAARPGVLRYGDLVFFRTDRSRVSHVGIYVGHDRFIHVSSSKGVIITHLQEEYWSQRFAGARRVLELAGE